MLDALVRLFVMNSVTHRQHPVAVNRDVTLRECMCGRQPLDVSERRSPRFPDHVEKEKISNRKIIQSIGDCRMSANAIQRVAEEQNLVKPRVIKRFDAEVISRTKQSLVAVIPDRKRKISQQSLHATRAPYSVGVQN